MSLLIRLFISVVALGILLTKIDYVSVVSLILKIDWKWLLLVPPMYLVQFISITKRWNLILFFLGKQIHFVRLFNLTYISIFFSQILPSTVGGDVVKVIYLKKMGIPIDISVNSVLIDRLCGLVALVAMVLSVFILFYPYYDDHLYPVFKQGIVWLALIIALFLGFGVWAKISGKIPKWNVVQKFTEMVESTKSFFLNFRIFSTALFYSLVGQASLIVGAFLISKSIDLQLPPLLFLFLFPQIILITALPVSFGGWGIREGTSVALFGLFGVPAVTAFSFSILYGISLLVLTLPSVVMILFLKVQKVD